MMNDKVITGDNRMTKFEDAFTVQDVQFNVTGLYEMKDGESVDIKEMEIYISSQEVSNIITDEVKSLIYKIAADELHL